MRELHREWTRQAQGQKALYIQLFVVLSNFSSVVKWLSPLRIWQQEVSSDEVHKGQVKYKGQGSLG